MVWVIVGIVLLLVIVFASLYNGIVSMRQLTRNAWADVDVFLKRRAELIPNLVTAIKAYATHEQALLEGIATARAAALSSQGPTQARAAAESEVSSGLSRALIIAEDYPELRSSDNFLSLQRELSETENKIANARQYYNACVRDLNIKIESFPSSIPAGFLGVKHMDFFETETAQERVAPSVGQ